MTSGTRKQAETEQESDWPYKVGCSNCGRMETLGEPKTITDPETGKRETWVLCDECEEESRIMLAEFLKYEM